MTLKSSSALPEMSVWLVVALKEAVQRRMEPGIVGRRAVPAKAEAGTATRNLQRNDGLHVVPVRPVYMQ